MVSNVAAGIVVGKFGTASVTGAELKKALEEKALKMCIRDRFGKAAELEFNGTSLKIYAE